MPFAPVATFTEIDWRHLARACRLVAALERARAEGLGRAGEDYLASARTFELLGEACTRAATGTT
jgi:hypothetical protein